MANRKFLKVYKNSKIYVFCPAQIKTGGPEALHALAFELKNKGYNVYMAYYNREENINPVADRYQKYEIPYTDNIEDIAENIIIIPETAGRYLKKFKNVQKAFWWLSVDFYLKTIKPKQYRGIKKIFRKLFPKKNQNIVDFKDDKILHLVQSHYAYKFCKDNNITNILFCTDYLNSDFLKNISENYKNRKNIILYNPKKGFEYTEKIIKAAPQIKFIPLIGFSQEEMCNIMKTSKIYIDFGNHPGKDRIPREAAILGNIIITNKKGSAGFYEDVPIDSFYKINDDEDVKNVVAKIELCMQQYDEKIADFENYRNIIKNERKNFLKELDEIFIESA